MSVLKYNLFKGLSTVFTVGTPITVLALQYDLFVHHPSTAISAGGIFAILVSLLFFKDKIAENWKTPSPLILSVIIFVLIILIEKVIEPVKVACIATIVACIGDELFLKRMYKSQEQKFSSEGIDLNNYKHFGFVFKFTKGLTGGNDE